jgi:hypothetical protein
VIRLLASTSDSRPAAQPTPAVRRQEMQTHGIR